jgi:DNA-directed RNA polymerase subunit H
MTKKIEHLLIPEHTKISEKEKKELLERYQISEHELPAILLKDPAIAHLNAKPGDVIMITRKSPTAGESVFYRVVKLE